MQFDTVNSETDGRGVCTVLLNRPDKHNVMSEQMIAELSALSTDLRESAVRVVVLAARGTSFCAGGDLK
jgi:methylglutaconyl-CoA hydratase